MTTDLKVGDVVECYDFVFPNVKFEGIVKHQKRFAVAVYVTKPTNWLGHDCDGHVPLDEDGHIRGRWFELDYCKVKTRAKRKSGFGSYILEKQL